MNNNTPTNYPYLAGAFETILRFTALDLCRAGIIDVSQIDKAQEVINAKVEACKERERAL